MDEFAQNLAARLRASYWRRRLPALDPRRRIELRRFAGCQIHADQISRPLRIAHLTDLHVGRVTPLKVQEAAAEMVNRLEPDLVVMTGDFVCHGCSYLDQLAHVLSCYRAPIVAVLGNHDHWSDADEVRAVLRRAGVELLDNAHTRITLRGQTLQLVGLDDAFTGHADAVKAVRGLRADLPTLGLSHIADEAESLWRAGVPLVLSGHTHACQVAVGRVNEWMLGRMAGHRYIHGLYGTRSEAPPVGGAVYVGAGIGAAVMPLRLGARARREVALFELGARPGNFAEDHAEQAEHPGRAASPREQAKRAHRVVRNRRRRERVALRREQRAVWRRKARSLLTNRSPSAD